MSARERNLLKAAVRRVFARSDLRREALESVKIVSHFDPEHPRVKHWSKCPHCRNIVPRYLFVVDHIAPVVPVHMTLELMTWDDLINNVWCEKSNLQPLCKECHAKKTSVERKLRKHHKGS